jgi:pimeloyl-ACP methyl ester carboxylesterase
MDIDELTQQLELGSKFYLIGTSMGAYSAYSCLKYIPERYAVPGTPYSL